MSNTWHLNPDRCFSPLPEQRALARDIFTHIKNLPLICPHGHVPPELLSNKNATLGTPTSMLVIPDHYVFRMLYSQGVPLETLGVPTTDNTPVETNHRKIWQTFADNYYLFSGTPTGLWLKDELIQVFGITKKLNSKNAQDIYDELNHKLTQPNYQPRALLKQFNIEYLATTDAATDTLEHHKQLHTEGLTHIRPTFRPDALINLQNPDWHQTIQTLEQQTNQPITNYQTYLNAIQTRREYFKQHGCQATDHAAQTPHTQPLTPTEANTIIQRALTNKLEPTDNERFTAHMLMEFARMSTEDNLVMQLHIGSHRNHNQPLFNKFGSDKGADIPQQTNWTQPLKNLLNTHGNNPNLTLVLFTLDESTYSRELAPLAGHYPAVRLGPPWWFFDSTKGMQRYLDATVETAGIYNLAGFNDDTRAFPSIPARHELWRRTTSNWLAGEVLTGMIDEEDAHTLAYELAYGLAKKTYNVPDA